MKHHFTLVASCPDRVGINARVSAFIAENNGWILETSHHSDFDEQLYFMRIVIRADSLPFGLAEFRKRFEPIASEFKMDWRITDSAVKKRVMLMVSKQGHCLFDLLARWHSKELSIEIPCVVSNHLEFKSFVEWHGIPFHYVPVSKDNKAEAFAEVDRIFQDVRADTMVLARYMQIIPVSMCQKYPNRIINIHHSFLPSFVGAKPYHQAFKRGVKLIGATCHYATAELDEGPIIEQDVNRVDHSDSVSAMVRYGKDIEKTVLARGLRSHIEDRVLTFGNKTIVFN